jgi:hypothetical protein
MGRGDFSEDVNSNWMDEKEMKAAIRLCDKCDKPGMWHLRAHTLFLCDEHRRKLEWERADVDTSTK